MPLTQVNSPKPWWRQPI